MINVHDNDNDNDRDESTRAGGSVAPSPAGVASLTALGAMLNAVDTTSVLGHSGRPMMQFKARQETWSFGVRRTIPEDGSPWAVNPTSFQHGFISFSDSNKVLGERLVSIGQPPDVPD